MNKILFALPLLFAFCTASSFAAEVTLTGIVTCARCDLKVVEKCATVIVAKENGKDVVYYFDRDGHNKYHGKTCKNPTGGSVTGEISMDGDKHMIKVSKVEYMK